MSAFAESAMAVNRVVLQHMSLNLLEEFPPYNSINGDIGISADQQVSISPTFYEQGGKRGLKYVTKVSRIIWMAPKEK